MLSMCLVCSAHLHANDTLLAFASKHIADTHAHLERAGVAHNDRSKLLHALALSGTTHHTPHAQHKHQRLGVALPSRVDLP